METGKQYHLACRLGNHFLSVQIYGGLYAIIQSPTLGDGCTEYSIIHETNEAIIHVIISTVSRVATIQSETEKFLETGRLDSSGPYS